MNERALFLSRLEFSIVLMAGGIEEISCFSLPEAKNVDEREMLKAMYSLVQKGLMQAEAHRLVLSGEMEEIVASIKDSAGYLFMESSDDAQPQRMIYLGKTVVILENSINISQDFRLFSKDIEEFWKWIEESIEAPAFEVVVNDEAVKLMEMNELALDEFQKLQECSYPGSSLGIRLWIKKIREKLGDVPCVGIRFVAGSKEIIVRDLLLCWGCANLWFLWCDPDKNRLSEKGSHVEVAPDAAETRKELLTFFRGETK